MTDCIRHMPGLSPGTVPSWLCFERFSPGIPEGIPPEPARIGLRDQPAVGGGLVGGGATLFLALFVLCFSAGQSEAAPLFVNEYNGVRDDRYLNGGDDLEDDDGEQASDVFFGPHRR